MGTVWYAISLKQRKCLTLGKSSESIEISEILKLAGCDDIQIINENSELAEDYDEYGSSNLHKLEEVRKSF